MAPSSPPGDWCPGYRSASAGCRYGGTCYPESRESEIEPAKLTGNPNKFDRKADQKSSGMTNRLRSWSKTSLSLLVLYHD